MPIGMLLKILSGLCLAGVLASCTPVPSRPEFEACQPLRVADCIAILDTKKLTLQEGNAVLRDVASVHLKNENPDAATDYLSVALKRDPTDGVAYRLRGDAYALHARIRQRDNDDFVPGSVRWHSAVASENYLLASMYEPQNQSNYRNAVSFAIAADACHLAEMIRALHEKGFGQTSDQAALAGMIKEKCGVEDK